MYNFGPNNGYNPPPPPFHSGPVGPGGPHCPGVPPVPPFPPTAQGYPEPVPPDRPGKFTVGVNQAKGVGFFQFPHPTMLVEMDFYDLMKLRDSISQAGWILYQTHMENLCGGPSAQFPLGRFGFPPDFHPNPNPNQE